MTRWTDESVSKNLEFVDRYFEALFYLAVQEWGSFKELILFKKFSWCEKLFKFCYFPADFWFD